MAFRWLVNVFQILSGKIKGRLGRVSGILIACARLHNFIIREDRSFGMTGKIVEEEMEQLDITPVPNAPFPISYLPVVPNEEYEVFDRISHTREGIRPAHNIEHRQREFQQYSLQSPKGEQCDREFISPF